MGSVCVSGYYAYTARHDGLFEIINVSDNFNPWMRGSLKYAVDGRTITD